jgi:hypothetical protein
MEEGALVLIIGGTDPVKVGVKNFVNANSEGMID